MRERRRCGKTWRMRFAREPPTGLRSRFPAYLGDIRRPTPVGDRTRAVRAVLQKRAAGRADRTAAPSRATGSGPAFGGEAIRPER
jgi:hypothetical protein